MKNQKLDWPGFTASIAVILAACIPLLLFPESGGKFLVNLYGNVTHHFGFLYLLWYGHRIKKDPSKRIMPDDDFDPGIDAGAWALIQNGTADVTCGSVSGNARRS